MIRLQNRHDTAANWTAANPLLAAGEVGCETDTGKLKVGNGSTYWNSLAYVTGGSSGHPPVGAPTLYSAHGTGTYTTPGSTTLLRVALLGAGGGGQAATGGTSLTQVGGGGGAGGYAEKWIASPSASYDYTVGTGGTSNANGTDTVWSVHSGGAIFTAGGGPRGSTGSAAATSGVAAGVGGGTITSADFGGPGSPGGFGVWVTAALGVGGNGGSSPSGGGGVGASTNNVGGNATGNGAGGGGAMATAAVAKNGGSGTDGLILVYAYY